MTTKDKLLHALTAYDRRQSAKRSYNVHALNLYFERVDSVCADIDNGVELRQAICAGFNDRLLDVCLRAVGLPVSTVEEARGKGGYTPTVKS